MALAGGTCSVHWRCHIDDPDVWYAS